MEHRSREHRPRSICGPPAQCPFEYQQCQGITAPRPQRDDDDDASLPLPQPRADDSDVEQRFEALVNRLDSRVTAVLHRCDVGPHSVLHNAAGDAIYRAQLATLPYVCPAVASSGTMAHLTDDTAFVVREIVLTDLFDAVLSEIDRRRVAAEVVHDAFVGQLMRDEAEQRAARRRVAEAEARQRAEERRRVYMSSADPMIMQLRQDTACRLAAQDAAAAAREEEEISRLEGRVASILAVVEPAAPTELNEAEWHAPDPDSTSCAASTPSERRSSSPPMQSIADHEEDLNTTDGDRNTLSETRARVIGACLDTAFNLVRPLQRYPLEQVELPRVAAKCPKPEPTEIPILVPRIRSRCERSTKPLHRQHDFISTATID